MKLLSGPGKTASKLSESIYQPLNMHALAASAALTLVVVLGLGVVTPQSAQAQTFTVLYNFTGASGGAGPYAGLIRDNKGNLYGTGYYGGSSDYGVVFKVDSSGAETVLYNFTEGADGGFPLGAVVRDKAGNLYGTASSGGDTACYSGCGTVFDEIASTPARFASVSRGTGVLAVIASASVPERSMLA